MRRYAHALSRIVTSLVEDRLARRREKGKYLIKKAMEAVVAVLRYDDGRQIRTTAPIFEPPQRLGLFGGAVSAGVMHRRQISLRGVLTAEGYEMSVATK
jgi:hypothetical protein